MQDTWFIALYIREKEDRCGAKISQIYCKQYTTKIVLLKYIKKYGEQLKSFFRWGLQFEFVKFTIRDMCECEICHIAKQLLLHDHLMSTIIQSLVKVQGVRNKVFSCLPTNWMKCKMQQFIHTFYMTCPNNKKGRI